jgi:hypothetical protein
MARRKAISEGTKVGRLTVVGELVNVNKYRQVLYICRCECSRLTIAISSQLRKGRKRSCGCLKQETKHGHTVGGHKSATYNSWQGMMRRCYNTHSAKYRIYGEKGIAVTSEWRTFKGFLRDMGVRQPGTTLGRLDHSKGYFKANCEWQTPLQQSASKKAHPNRNGKKPPVSVTAPLAKAASAS